ncbi:hypothetical protein WMC73_24200, partial [Citrobacter braakii]|uniref:hypothetical protein n=1 Tax=Citrobacter braakii TaxID=57706 RepID=UPI00374FD13F
RQAVKSGRFLKPLPQKKRTGFRLIITRKYRSRRWPIELLLPIYNIASEAIAHGDGRWDAASLTSYLTAYQQVTPLTLGEVWAL